MKQKIYTIKELQETGLEIVGSHMSPKNYKISVGDKYLTSEVISQWDFGNYDDFFTYFENGIQFVVNLCERTKDGRKCGYLKKDLSNITNK